MSLKLVFNNEIHRVSKLPVSITALTNYVTVLFNGTLPATWGLQYLDSEGDKVMLKTEEDFQALLAEAAGSNKTVKIYVTSDGQFEQIDDTEYQIIQKEDEMEKTFPIEQPTNVIYSQPLEQPDNVLNTNRDKVEGLFWKREKPWMKFCNAPKYQTLKLFKQLRDENTPGDEKVILLKDFEAKKAELPEEEREWLDRKIAQKLSSKECDKPRRPMIYRAMCVLKRSFEEEISVEEKAEMEKKLAELLEQMPEDQKAAIEEKRQKFIHKANKREKESGKLKFADAFSEFLKKNISNVTEIIGDQFKGKPHCREMKKLIEELCMTFSALPEEKQADVSISLKGIPERMIACLKSKQERKVEKRKEKEFKKLNPIDETPLEEEKLEPKKEKKERKEWKEKKEERKRLEKLAKCEEKERKRSEKKEEKEKKEKKDKSKSPKKEKSVEKKTLLATATETIKESVATVTQAVQDAAVAAKEALTKKKYAPGIIAKANQIREIFPDADADTLNEFVKNHYKLTTEQLIDEFLTTYKN